MLKQWLIKRCRKLPCKCNNIWNEIVFGRKSFTVFSAWISSNCKGKTEKLISEGKKFLMKDCL